MTTETRTIARRLPQQASRAHLNYALLGLVHTTSFLWRGSEGRLVKQLRGLFRELQIDGVIDVGANRGRYIEMLRGCIGFRGPLAAIDPVPENVQAVRAHAAYDPNLKVIAAAIGADNGTIQINVTSTGTLSSVFTPKQDGVGRFSALSQVRDKIDVELRTLDSLLPELFGDESPERLFLKTDTQGFDLNVLRGAERVLQRTMGLQIEIPFVPLYEGVPQASEYFRTLEDLGFALVGFHPVNRLPDGRIIDVDGVFRRL